MVHTLSDARRTALASLLQIVICVICGRSVDADLGVNALAIHRDCARRARTAPPANLSPTDRARVRQRLAYLLGEGLAVTRTDVLTELHTERPAASGITPADISVSLPTRGDAFASPAVTPDAVPDAPVSFAAAADRLGVSVATVKRYAAPSSGKLVRLGDGVGQASVEALAATR